MHIIKVKFILGLITNLQMGSRGTALFFLNLAQCGFGWSTPHPGRFTPLNYPVPNVRVNVAWWPAGQVSTGAENLVPIGFRSSDRPARTESLYRLSYPGPQHTQHSA
jgi:hypothetical protein